MMCVKFCVFSSFLRFFVKFCVFSPLTFFQLSVTGPNPELLGW